MLCRMCLLESDNTLCIFEPYSGPFQIAPTIGRHFWFEPTKDDPISITICETCWSKISDFHTYYMTIEGAQRLLTEYSSLKKKSKIASVEHLKNDYTEYVDKKDDGMLKEASKNPTSKITATDNGNCPVFVNAGHADSYNNLGDPTLESVSDDYRSVRRDSSNCLSDDEPLAQKAARTIAQKNSVKQEPETRRRGRKPAGKNKPKRSDVSTYRIEAEKGSIESRQNQSVSSDNDASVPAIMENCLDVQIKVEQSGCSSDQCDATDMQLKNSCDEKGESEKPDTTKRVRKTPDPEYQKKNQMYDDEISKFVALQCGFCSTPFKTFTDVKRHSRTTHNKNGYVVCCKRKFFKRYYLFEHIQRHKNPDMFKCQHCDKVYCSAEVLRRHLRTHDASYDKPHQCDICQRRFISLWVLNNHKSLHIPKEEHSFVCDDCGKTFPSKNIMETHRRTVHEKAYTKMCHICAKVITGKAFFTQHQLEHEGNVDPKVQCEQCGMWLKNKIRLKAHTRKLHSEQSSVEHICHICQKVSTSRSGLMKHIRYIHLAERKFSCQVCEKSFKKAVSLKEHMTTHTGDVLYTCAYCPKTFNSNSNMHSHRKKMHRQEWEESRKNCGLPVKIK